MLACLHQPEVTLRKMDRLVAGNGTNDRNAEWRDGALDHETMPLAADAIEHDAVDVDSRVVTGKATQHCGGGLSLARDVENKEDGQIECDREFGGGAGSLAARAVEQAHGGFDDQQVRIGPRLPPPHVSSSDGGMAQLSRLRLGAPVATS